MNEQLETINVGGNVRVKSMRIEKGKENLEARARLTELKETKADRIKESLKRFGKKSADIVDKVYSPVRKVASKIAFSRPKKFKKILRKGSRATIVLNQPVYLEDKQRFFNEAIKQERRNLFFK